MALIRAMSGSSGGGGSSTYTIKQAVSVNGTGATKDFTIEAGKNYMVYGTPPILYVDQSSRRELYFYQNGTITKVGDGNNSTLTKISDTVLRYTRSSSLNFYVTLFEEA